MHQAIGNLVRSRIDAWNDWRRKETREMMIVESLRLVSDIENIDDHVRVRVVWFMVASLII